MTPLWQRLMLRRLKMLLVLVGAVVVIGGGVYLAAPQWLVQLQTWQQAMGAHVDTYSVLAGDTTWSYYDGGNGPAIVLLHDYGADKSTWLPVAKQLTRNFRVIVPDLPGWGESSRQPGADYGIDAQAERLAAFVHALNLPRMMLVGHGMGGAIAGVYAAAHPDRVAGLVLIDSAGLKAKDNAFTRAARSGNPFDFDDRAGYRRVAELVFDTPPALPGRFIDVRVARNVANRAFRDRVFDRLRDEDDILDAHLGELTMPVLGVWCHDDRVTDVSALDTLRNGLTHASSIGASTINACGHAPQLEKPDVTAKILSGFAIAH
ncbi:MAG TPA: alpha/beta fold hydrolase [Rhodanobacteraceae bacterium]|nr:alpha/beta fold hydrolase [Rhodanobacteraceae bacterium]